MKPFRLAACRGPVRALLTGFLITTGLGFSVAVLEVHAAMGGFAPDAITRTIRGDETPAAAEFAEEFGEDPAGLRFGKGYREMLQTAHTHSFAMPLLFFALGGVFLGSDVSDRAKTLLLAVTFASLVLDLGSLWLVRYLSGAFASVNIATGTVLSACAAALILRSLWDLWRPAGA